MPRPPEPSLPRKLRLRAHGQHNVFTWHPPERAEHVLMKAFLWALYLPTYPDLAVEVRIGDRYKPDVVSYGPPSPFEAGPQPRFWGEAGQVSADKLATLLRRYPAAHFAIAKWDANLTPLEALVRDAAASTARAAPVDLLRFAPGDETRFIGGGGAVHISFGALADVRRLFA